MIDSKLRASVVLPVYNADNYLADAIESVLQQSFKSFELLLLNDGSTDKSEAIIDKYVNLDKRCRKLSWPNKGLIETLNTGIQEAKGEIVFRMDADDICVPNRFDAQLRYLSEHPDCVAVGSRVLLIDDTGLPIMPFNVPTEHKDIDKSNFRGYGSAIVHPTVAIRREALLQAGGYRAKYVHAEDIDLFFRLAEIGKLHNLPDILLQYRQHPMSIGYSKRQEQVNSVRQAIKDTLSRRGIASDNILSEDTIELTSIKDVYKKWAWWAIKGGNRKTAIKYAVKVMRSGPFNKENIKLFLCAIRGY